MIILTIRTDKPEAELGLYDDDLQLAYLTWEAHRKLSDTIHLKIKELLQGENKSLKEIEGILIFKGPGSFTGLRIGFSVANALADSLHIPIISAKDEKWIETGIKKLQSGNNEIAALPEYGALPNITTPKK